MHETDEHSGPFNFAETDLATFGGGEQVPATISYVLPCSNKRFGKSVFSVSSTLQLFAIGLILGILTQLWGGPFLANAKDFYAGGKSKLTEPDGALSPELFQAQFGDEAVEHCERHCETRNASNLSSCARSCKRLHASVFGKRITLGDLSPAVDAERMASACVTEKQQLGRAPSRDAWIASLEKVKRLNEQSKRLPSLLEERELAALSTAIIDLERGLGIPPSATIDEQNGIEELRRNTCLQSHLILSYRAMRESERKADTFSARHYFGIYERLLSRIQERDVRLAPWLSQSIEDNT